MAKGRTLWEMLTDAVQGPAELRYYNPLKARVGASVTIDDLDWKDYTFFIREVREYRRVISGREYPFVDYVLVARPLNADEVRVRLRLNPVEDPDAAGGLTHHALLLHLSDEMAYDEGLHNVVTDTTRKFQVLQDGKVTEEYYRLNDVTDSYKAQVTVLKDADHDNRVTPDEVERLEIEYWDYMREVQDEAGQPVTEYLFVEMDRNNGWFQIWQGREADPQKVLVI
jgi:hypothetical protein